MHTQESLAWPQFILDHAHQHFESLVHDGEMQHVYSPLPELTTAQARSEAFTEFVQRMADYGRCTVVGHDFTSDGADPENGSEDLRCVRCGYAERIYM